MDEALKARLIGATVLVALAVMLIPELLSGRRPVDSTAATSGDVPRGTRTFTIDLGGSGTGSTAPGPGRVESPPTEPAAASSSSDAAPPAGAAAATSPVGGSPAGVSVAGPAPSEPTVSRLEPRPAAPPPLAKQAEGAASQAAEPPAPEDAAPPPGPAAGARGGWSVQVGAFGTSAAAGKLVRELQEAGYRAYVSPVSRGGKTLHRVRVGPEPDRGSATSLVAGLRARGLPATVVAND